MTDQPMRTVADAYERGRPTYPVEAVAWLVRVQSDQATADDWAALTAWLEASDDHLAAFEEIEGLAAELQRPGSG